MASPAAINQTIAPTTSAESHRTQPSNPKRVLSEIEERKMLVYETDTQKIKKVDRKALEESYQSLFSPFKNQSLY
jgi:hypothetical protein